MYRYMYVASSTSEHLMNQILHYQKLPQQAHVLPTVLVPVSQNKTVPCMLYDKTKCLADQVGPSTFSQDAWI